MTRSVAFGVAATLSLACSSAGISGGVLVAPGSEPEGATLAFFNVTRCEDANGARVPEPEARVTLVRMSDGRSVLVERRPGYDSLIVENGWNEGDTRVFQLALKRSGKGPLLREYRVPRSKSGSGQIIVVERVGDWGDSSRGFHARYAKPSMACELSSV